MASLEDIRRALAASITAGIGGGVNVNPYPQLGAAGQRITVAASSNGYIGYGTAFDSTAMAVIRYELWIEVTAADDVSPQIVLDAYLSAGVGARLSIVDALAADSTLDGLVDDVRCVAARVLQITPDGPQVAVIDVEVLLSERD